MPAESKDKLLDRIERTYAELIDFVETLEVETVIQRQGENEWSIKDIIAHVLAWEDILLRFHISGEEFEDVVGLPNVRYRDTPFDEINRHLFELYCDWPFEEVKALAERTHDKLFRRLKKISWEELQAPPAKLVAKGITTDNLASCIASNTYEHYVEHLETARRLGDLAG
jgi:hypothetical protein